MKSFSPGSTYLYPGLSFVAHVLPLLVINSAMMLQANFFKHKWILRQYGYT
jgi:hypothetical protein